MGHLPYTGLQQPWGRSYHWQLAGVLQTRALLENLHRNSFMSSVLDSPWDTLYSWVQKVFAPERRKMEQEYRPETSAPNHTVAGCYKHVLEDLLNNKYSWSAWYIMCMIPMNACMPLKEILVLIISIIRFVFGNFRGSYHSVKDQQNILVCSKDISKTMIRSICELVNSTSVSILMVGIS